MATRTATWTESRSPASPSAIDGLAERLDDLIERKTCGRILDLHVDCSGDQITLTGRARTQYAKQLALEAVLDQTDGRTALRNRIVVSC